MKTSLVIAALAASSLGLVGASFAASPTDETTLVADASGNSAFVYTQNRDRRGDRRGGPDAVLFTNPDFGGQRFVVDGDYMPDLANTGFNDRAQSLRVNRGYWIFCSDAQFRGQCRTFGPGDYGRLGWALDNKVSSGRRISNRYPYGGRPNWEDRRQ
jgi:hypothetical protein